MPGGGVLVDTPGLRGVGLYDVDAGLAQAFADIEAFAVDCKFGDCSPTAEPGCAVLAAVDAGAVDARRLSSWRRLQREAAWMASRHDALARIQQRRKWKAMHKSVRASGVVRP